MPKDSSREAHFPAIEKKYGEKMAYWFKVMTKLEGKKYPEQIAHLRENYGFSQAHANALVMFSRGSESSKRFATHSDFYKSVTPEQAKTMKAIFKAITTKFPQLELVIAWNQPILRVGKQSILGVSASKNHLTINPFSIDVLEAHEKKLTDFVVNKYTFQVPTDWKANTSLLQSLVRTRLKEIV
jgi:uncharacterized protein YdhG (YjbR/CyaY superfamily)